MTVDAFGTGALPIDGAVELLERVREALGVPAGVVRPYRISGTALLATFALSLVTVAVSLLWLINGGPAPLYDWAIALFAILLIAVFAAAVWATRMVLWQ